MAGIATARAFLIGRVGYLLLFVYGLIVDHDDDGDFVPLNTADDWLLSRPGRDERA